MHTVHTGLIALTGGETVLLAGLMWLLYAKSLAREFCYFFAYVIASLLIDVIYLTVAALYVKNVFPDNTIFATYFIAYYVLSIFKTLLILGIVYSMYAQATRNLPGLQQLGKSCFRGTVAVAGAIALGSAFSPHISALPAVVTISQQMIRLDSILILCVLSFLVFTARALGVPYGSRIFGITFGILIVTLYRVAEFPFFISDPAQATHLRELGECIAIASVSLWMVYFLKAEPERKIVTVPIDAPILQWNMIARLLGHSAGHVVVSHPSTLLPGIMAKPANESYTDENSNIASTSNG